MHTHNIKIFVYRMGGGNTSIQGALGEHGTGARRGD